MTVDVQQFRTNFPLGFRMPKYRVGECAGRSFSFRAGDVNDF